MMMMIKINDIWNDNYDGDDGNFHDDDGNVDDDENNTKEMKILWLLSRNLRILGTITTWKKRVNKFEH